MFEICLSKNIQKSKFHDLTHAWREGVDRMYSEDILKFVPAESTNLGQQYDLISHLICNDEAQKYA